MRRFDIVHNIPSPYRIHLFAALATQLRQHGFRLHVHFLAKEHRDRAHWKQMPCELEHTFWWDAGWQTRHKAWHFNPGLIAHLVSTPPHVLMVGGPWDSVTGALAMTCVASPVKLAWIEVNTKTPGRVAGRAASVKRRLLRAATAIVVPGIDATAHVRKLLNLDTPILTLPNLVDEQRFSMNVTHAIRAELGVRASERLCIWPARLIEAKGVANFLGKVRKETLDGWRVLILGDGPLKSEIERVLRDTGLRDRVILRSSVSYDAMPSLYAAADLFLLPSLSDPNPLSVVEAMHSSLPLLLSDRLGNVEEALQQGINGWLFDPTDAESVERGCRAAFGCDSLTLKAMGTSSKARASQLWSTQTRVTDFVREAMHLAYGSASSPANVLHS